MPGKTLPGARPESPGTQLPGARPTIPGAMPARPGKRVRPHRPVKTLAGAPGANSWSTLLPKRPGQVCDALETQERLTRHSHHSIGRACILLSCARAFSSRLQTFFKCWRIMFHFVFPVLATPSVPTNAHGLRTVLCAPRSFSMPKTVCPPCLNTCRFYCHARPPLMCTRVPGPWRTLSVDMCRFMLAFVSSLRRACHGGACMWIAVLLGRVWVCCCPCAGQGA
jgi:hypothetical protein